jgi:hypothetical protein
MIDGVSPNGRYWRFCAMGSRPSHSFVDAFNNPSWPLVERRQKAQHP